MNVIVCLDDGGGMTMNHRRLSRDRLLIENVIELVGDNCLTMSEYSAPLFQEHANAKMMVDAQYLAHAKAEDFCFVEREALLPHIDKIQKIIVYHWNRRYPATSFFDLPLEAWHRTDTTDFAGYSHEKITKEIYIK